MFNIQKAVSRLKFAPPLKEIAVTGIENGLTMFTLKPNEPVSFSALRAALKKAGYKLASAEITVAGLVARDDGALWIVAGQSGQRFALEGAEAEQPSADSHSEVTGDWKTTGQPPNEREVITLKQPKMPASRGAPQPDSVESVDLMSGELPSGLEVSVAVAPIRTTSPGLTVYRGGAISPRYFNIAQKQGDLEITRHVIQLNLSYTPTPGLQLAAEIPYARAEFSDGARSASGEGFGNITVWGKYRFFRRDG